MPWDGLHYLTCQQDFVSAWYVYTDHIDRLTGNIPRLLRYIDNTLTYSNSTKAAFFRASNLLNLYGNKGVILIPYKFQFVEREVEFLGFLVTSSKMLPTSRYMEPSSLTNVQSSFGAVAQVVYAFSMSTVMEPLYHFSMSKTAF